MRCRSCCSRSRSRGRTALPAADPPADVRRRGGGALAKSLETTTGDQLSAPGSNGDLDAASWFGAAMTGFGLEASRPRTSTATIPGSGRRGSRNVLAVVPGRSPQTIVVTAHRDNAGDGPRRRGRDNAAATRRQLVQIAQAFTRVKPEHTLVFLSTDGGTAGGLGARYFVDHARRGAESRRRRQSRYNCHERPGANRDLRPRPALPLADAARLRDRAPDGPDPARPPGGRASSGSSSTSPSRSASTSSGRSSATAISAITLTTAGDRPGLGPRRRRRSTQTRLGQIGSAAQTLVASLEQGLELVPGHEQLRLLRRADRARLGDRACADRARRAFRRRRRRPLRPLPPPTRAARPGLPRLPAPARLLALGRRALRLFALFGAFPDGAAVPPDPASSAAGDWPRLALLLFVVLVAASWLVARRRLAPTRPVTAEEELAGQTAALLVLGADLAARRWRRTSTRYFCSYLRCTPGSGCRRCGTGSAVARGLVFAAGLLGPAALPRSVREALRARPRHPLVPCGADRYRLRTDCGRRSRPGLGRRRRAAPRRSRGTLRPLSGRGRGRSARCRALQRPHGRARSPWRAAAADDAQGVRGMRQARPDHGRGPARGGGPRHRLGAARLAVAGPGHGAVHDLPAAPPVGELRAGVRRPTGCRPFPSPPPSPRKHDGRPPGRGAAGREGGARSYRLHARARRGASAG